MASVLFTFDSVEKGARYNITNSSHHLRPPGIIVTSFGFGPLNVCGLTGRSLLYHETLSGVYYFLII